MSFYGNIINYFSAAFKRFKFKNKNSEEAINVEASLSQDELYFNSSSDNYIFYEYNEAPSADGKRKLKSIDLQLNVEKLRADVTTEVIPSLSNDEENMVSYYQIKQKNPTLTDEEELPNSEIKYYAKYDENTGNLYLPFIHIV